MAARRATRGTIVAFDARRGLGRVEGDDGAVLPFHCTEIADGSRSIGVGLTVRYEVVPGALGVWEAGALEAC